MKQAEPQSCAIRTRTYAGKPAAIEMGDEVANAITSVQKDSMVAEPTIENVGNIYPSGGQGGKVVATTGLAPAVCECHGEVTRVVEGQEQPQPKIMEQQPHYRIRKLTPRECYRLMDVDDRHIDRLLNTKDQNGKPLIAKSQHYKLAGNSIVVSCLYHLFRRMFVETEPTLAIQLELF